MGSGHGHGAAPRRDSPAPAAVRRALAWVLGPLAALTLLAMVLLWPARPELPDQGLGLPANLVRGTVTRLQVLPCPGSSDPGRDPGRDPAAEPDPEDPAPDPDGGRAVECARAHIRLTSGPEAGETVRVEVTRDAAGVPVEAGAKVVLAHEPDAPEEARYHVVDAQRGRPLVLLGLVFAVAVIGLGRWRGLAALGGLVVSFGVLTSFALPALLGGAPPLPIAIVASAAILFAALYLAHGFNVRTSTAVLGTLVSLVLTGALAAGFVAAGRFTGLASEEAIFLGATNARLDLHGLLLAGVIIGSLGVLDDVTVTQASAVWELRAANPAYGFRELYRSGVRIGRDHIASTVNTLVLAYAGASLPLLLLFGVAERPLGDVLTNEVVAQEVVRTLVGSIGLVAAVPVTTALAAVVASAALVRPVAVPSDATAEPDADDDWLAHLRRTWRDADAGES